MRRLRQSDRHRRGPGRARQDQKYLSGRYRLLAGRNDEMVEGAADSERPEIRLPRPPAVLRAHAPAAASAVERERAFSRTGRVLQIPRKRTLQDTVPRHAVALHRKNRLPRLRGNTTPQGSAVRAGRGQEHRRTGYHAGRRARILFRRIAARRTGRRDGPARADRNPQPAAVPQRGGSRLPDARPALLDAVRRREPADQSGHVAGQQPGRIALHSRRAEHRTASEGHGTADRRAEKAARSGQHSDRRRA